MTDRRVVPFPIRQGRRCWVPGQKIPVSKSDLLGLAKFADQDAKDALARGATDEAVKARVKAASFRRSARAAR
jgi:hypothetical protein